MSFRSCSTIFKIWKPFPRNPNRQLIANRHPTPYTQPYKAWVQKNTFWLPPYSSTNKNQTSKTLWPPSHFSTSMLSFYRPDFCLLRLQICTSWSSPVSATTSTFVLVCPVDQTFKLQLLHATICPSVAQRLQRSLSLQLSTTHASMFPFCLTFGALDFHFGYLSLSIFRSFPFDFASLSGFSSLQLIQLRISFVHWFVF